MRAITPSTANLLRPAERIHPNDRLELTRLSDGSSATRTSFQASVHSVHGTERRMPYSLQAMQFIERRLPEWTRIEHYDAAKHGFVKLYGLPATDYTAEIIRQAWPSAQLSFSDCSTELLFQSLILRGVVEDMCAENVAKYKDAKLLPSGHIAFEYNKNHPLAEYQKLALCNSYATPSYALFMEQGTGKTSVVVARVCNDARVSSKFNNKRMYRALIVCPKNVRQNWVKEFTKFTTRKGKVTILNGSAINRLTQLTEAFATEEDEDFCYSVVVCTYDLIGRYFRSDSNTDSKFPNPFESIHWDLVVADESHYVKTPRAQRTKALHTLTHTRADRRMILTGTPITNSFFDLWAQFETLDPNGSGFSSFKKFREFFGVFKPDEQGHNSLVSYQNVPLLQERLARKAFIISKKEALPHLPDKSYDLISVEMTSKQQQIYDRVATEIQVEIESELNANETNQLTVNNALTKLLRLAQITSGFIVYDAINDDEGNEIQPQITDRFDPDNKLEELVNILKAKQPTDKTIIWTCWVQNIKTIAARLKLEGIKAVTFYGRTSDNDRLEAEKLFNEDNETKVFIGNPSAGGTGLNLLGNSSDDHSCNHVIYYSQNWSAVHRSQSEDRAHRRGTKNPVQYTDLCVFGSIDEQIRERVVEKRLHALKVSDIREILKGIIGKNEKQCNS